MERRQNPNVREHEDETEWNGGRIQMERNTRTKPNGTAKARPNGTERARPNETETNRTAREREREKEREKKSEKESTVNS